MQPTTRSTVKCFRTEYKEQTMPFQLCRVALVVGIGALLAAGCARAPKKEVEASNPWCQFAPGSWVTLRTVTKATADGRETEQVMEQTLTLCELTADKVILEQTNIRDGKEMTARVEAPRTMPPRPASGNA